MLFYVHRPTIVNGSEDGLHTWLRPVTALGFLAARFRVYDLGHSLALTSEDSYSPRWYLYLPRE